MQFPQAGGRRGLALPPSALSTHARAATESDTVDNRTENDSADISANDTAHEEYLAVHENKSLHEQLIAWSRANGLDPHEVSSRFRPTIADGKLTYARFIRNAEGHIQIDPASANEVATETVTVTL